MRGHSVAALGAAALIALATVGCGGRGGFSIPTFTVPTFPPIFATPAPTRDVAQRVANRFDAFWNRYKHKPIEAEDSSNLNQCMDAAFAYVDVVGIDRSVIRQLSARAVPGGSQVSSYFDVLPNPTTTPPPKGALVVIDSGLPDGHIAIATGDSGHKKGELMFDAVSQNWNSVQTLEEDTFHSKNVIAILVPRVLGPQGTFLP
jgi:hypothetical protein